MPDILIACFLPDAEAKIIAGLRQRGHRAVSVPGPAELRASLEREQWDVLAVAINPEDDWLAPFFEELRAHPRTAKLPVLAALPKVGMGEIEKMFALGVNECLTRPFRIGMILDKIGELTTGNKVETPQFPSVIVKVMQTVLEEGRRLGDVTEIFPGVSVHDPRARRMACISPEWLPAITEDAISPFSIGQEREFYLLRRDLVSRLPKPEEYDCEEKILLKRTYNPPCAALDHTHSLYSSALYGIRTVKGLSCGYLCCVLNSRFAQFYFGRYRPPAEGLRGVYLSRADIEAFPFAIPPEKEQKKFIDTAKRLATLPVTTRNPNRLIERGKLLGEMNRALFRIHGFDDEAVNALAGLHF